ncbi:MAG: PEP-CTERM sorting domain-containing protein [Sphingomonadaceae bacterium]|nr:PEP-CTERM sorting domain-containing protein [Sphingomonadaceae bacterium]
MIRITTTAAAAALLATGARADILFLNYEAPGVEYTTAKFTTVGVETFDTRVSGQSFTTDFGTRGAIQATYSAVQINAADQYGGAAGTGSYPVAFSDTPYSLHFTADPRLFPHGVNYFGYWLSALDAGNQVAFYRGGVEVGSLSPGQVLAKIGHNRNYFGNPNPGFTGQDGNEPFAFINFYDRKGSFDEVRFFQIGRGGGYESDNHTVGFYTATGGTPEPATWALLVTGFGLVGAGLRRRAAVPRVTSPAT